MKKVAFYTLGCKLNFSESSSLARMFSEKGFEKVEFYDKPDIYIINTCSVTDNSDKKCRKIVKEAQKISPHAFICIIGCYAQLKPDEIASIPGVDAVLGASEKFKILDLLRNFEKPVKPVIFNSPISESKDYYCSYSINDRTRTFLKVQDGCDYSCTFCTIPLARGKSRSAKINNILNLAEEIADSGVKEVVLTGVNIGDFGIIEGKRESNFLNLLQGLDKVNGIERFRISSIEPNLLSDDIIEFVAKSRKFAPHFHIPLQSGSNKILKLMRRRYLRELYAERVTKIKKLLPDACIGVDVICGFPGETEEDFLETFQFLSELEISYLHVFTYSERENTLAIHLTDPVPATIRNKRSRRLRELSDRKRHYFYEHQLGKQKKILFEEETSQNGLMYGFSENYIKVAIPYDPCLINELRSLTLKKISGDGWVETEEIKKSIFQ